MEASEDTSNTLLIAGKVVVLPPVWNLIYCNEPEISLWKIYVFVAEAVCALEGGFPKSLENIPEKYCACSWDHMHGTLPSILSVAMQIGGKESLHGEWQPFLVSDPDGNQRLIGKSLNTHIWILLHQKRKSLLGQNVQPQRLCILRVQFRKNWKGHGETLILSNLRGRSH